MKRFRIFSLIIIALATLSSTAIAADKNDRDDKQREKRMEELRQYKQEFLIKEVELSEKQQKEFIPLYAQMQDELYQINREARDAEAKVSKAANPSDAEYEAAAAQMLGVKQREAQIEKGYYDKFAKILSKKQLFLLQRAESRFSRHVLKHNRRAPADVRPPHDGKGPAAKGKASQR